jgi:hypothetical protein
MACQGGDRSGSARSSLKEALFFSHHMGCEKMGEIPLMWENDHQLWDIASFRRNDLIFGETRSRGSVLFSSSKTWMKEAHMGWGIGCSVYFDCIKQWLQTMRFWGPLFSTQMKLEAATGWQQTQMTLNKADKIRISLYPLKTFVCY